MTTTKALPIQQDHVDALCRAHGCQMQYVEARNGRMTEALQQLQQWADAYPLIAFPEPDFKRAAELLRAGGMRLDEINASNMRHVLTGVTAIATAALAGEPDNAG